MSSSSTAEAGKKAGATRIIIKRRTDRNQNTTNNNSNVEKKAPASSVSKTTHSKEEKVVVSSSNQFKEELVPTNSPDLSVEEREAQEAEVNSVDGVSEMSYVSDGFTGCGPSGEQFGHSPVSPNLRLKILKQQRKDRKKLRQVLNPNAKTMKTTRDKSQNSSRMTSRRGTEVESRRASKEEELFESSFKTITEEVIGPEPRVVIPTRLVQEEAARSPTPPRSYSVEQMRREEKPKESPAKKSPGPKVYAYETPTKTLKGAPRVEEKKKPEPKPAHRDPNSAPTSPKKPTHSPVRQVVVHSQKEIYVESPTVSGSAHLSKQPLLPPLANQEEAERTLTIVFDLDETLCNNRRMGPAVLRPGAITVLRSLRDCLPSPVPGQSSRSETPQSASTRLYEQSKPKLRKRSTSLSFGSLETPGARLEIVLWTASVEVVARAVVQRLDPNGDIFDHLIYRDVRWYREASYAKDLRRLGRPLDNVVIVENAPASVALNRSNAVLVNDFVNNRNDRQLYVVRSILLEWLKRCDHSFRHIAYRGTPSEGRSPPASAKPKPEYLGPLHQTVLLQRKMEEKARRAEETGEWSSSTTQTSYESIPRSVPIAKFLTSHKYMSPGTNYIKLSAVREVVLKLSNAKSKANQKREEEEGPPAKATRPPPAATNVKGYMGKIRPRLPVSIDPMAPKSTAFQPLDGSANLPPPPPSPPKSSTPRATRGKTISHPSKGGKSA